MSTVSTTSLTRVPAPKEIKIDALKALADWSKWLVSINSLLSAASIFFDARQGEIREKYGARLKYAAAFFMFSIMVAGVLLGAIPSAMEQAEHLPHSIYDYKQFGMLKLWSLASLEHVLFVFGLLFMLPIIE